VVKAGLVWPGKVHLGLEWRRLASASIDDVSAGMWSGHVERPGHSIEAKHYSLSE
jgi:hypothetical protein